MVTGALVLACVGLAVDFVARPGHLDRYGPKKARRRRTDRI
jgi:hypothetical protein